MGIPMPGRRWQPVSAAPQGASTRQTAIRGTDTGSVWA